MLALEYQAPRTLGLIETPTPRAEQGEIVLDVVAAGICGTDLKIFRGEHRLYPAGAVRVPGHEFVGRVRENRSERTDLIEGTLVAVAPNIGCGNCAACAAGRSNVCEFYESVGLTMDGAFAEAVRIPRGAVKQGNVIPVPPGLDPLVAVLMEPLAAVLRGVNAIELGEGDTVVVCGAGPIGLLAVILARQLGAGRIIVSQTSAARRALALEFGADVAIDPRTDDLVTRVLPETAGAGADCVIVATPAPGVYGQAVKLAAIGGRVNYFAGLPSGKGEVTIDANLIHYRELRVTGSTANTTQDCVDALEILAAAPDAYGRLVTNRFPLTSGEEAFAASADGSELKVVIEP